MKRHTCAAPVLNENEDLMAAPYHNQLGYNPIQGLDIGVLLQTGIAACGGKNAKLLHP
jgi:hypothetical protein